MGAAHAVHQRLSKAWDPSSTCYQKVATRLTYCTYLRPSGGGASEAIRERYRVPDFWQACPHETGSQRPGLRASLFASQLIAGCLTRIRLPCNL
jgi:hypothetical protein